VPPSTDVAGPDELYADAAAKTAMYARLSRNAAAAGDGRLAVSAAWAADIHAVQALLWERARDSDAEPYERFFAVGTAIGAALDPAAPAVVPTGAKEDTRTARGVLESARRRLLAAFDPPAALLISARLIAVDHLAALPAPGTGTEAAAGSLARRLAGRDVSAAVVDLWTVATDCRTVACALAEAGLAADAVRQTRLAEVAAFEAYLLEASLAVGDSALLCADLRRAALAEALPSVKLLPEDPAAARQVVREAMRAVLGPAEAARLDVRLATLDADGPGAELPEGLAENRAEDVAENRAEGVAENLTEGVAVAVEAGPDASPSRSRPGTDSLPAPRAFFASDRDPAAAARTGSGGDGSALPTDGSP
jgi:hypothetical protein